MEYVRVEKVLSCYLLTTTVAYRSEREPRFVYRFCHDKAKQYVRRRGRELGKTWTITIVNTLYFVAVI